jgi:hypothetical protein
MQAQLDFECCIYQCPGRVEHLRIFGTDASVRDIYPRSADNKLPPCLSRLFVVHSGGHDVCAVHDSLFLYACGDRDALTDDRLLNSDSRCIIISTRRLQLLPHRAPLTQGPDSYWAGAGSMEPQRSLHTSPASRTTNVTLMFWNRRHDITPRK